MTDLTPKLIPDFYLADTMPLKNFCLFRGIIPE